MRPRGSSNKICLSCRYLAEPNIIFGNCLYIPRTSLIGEIERKGIFIVSLVALFVSFFVVQSPIGKEYSLILLITVMILLTFPLLDYGRLSFLWLGKQNSNYRDKLYFLMKYFLKEVPIDVLKEYLNSKGYSLCSNCVFL